MFFMTGVIIRKERTVENSQNLRVECVCVVCVCVCRGVASSNPSYNEGEGFTFIPAKM